MSSNLKQTFKKALCVTGLILGASNYCVTANATESYAESDEWTTVNGFQLSTGSCTPNESTEFDVCDPEVAKKLKKMIKVKPNFGKKNTSVLTRFWDKGTDSWYYIAVNKANNKVHPFFMGVRNETFIFPELKNQNNIKLSFGKNRDRICTSGVGVAFMGDSQYPTRVDEYKTADFCSFYDEENGFVGGNLYDSKTGKLILDNEDIE